MIHMIYHSRESGIQDFEHGTETTSELLERILYYQMQYDELCEFTHNEKKIYEESFSIQV